MFLPLLRVGEGVQTPTTIHRGNVSLKIIKPAQRISYPFSWKLLFWELLFLLFCFTSIDQAWVES